MKILFAHRFFPTQFRHLATALATETENEVVALTNPNGGDPLHTAFDRDRLRIKSFADYLPAQDAGTPTHARPLVEDLRTARAVYLAARSLQETEGFQPDVIIANGLWGEGLYLREAFPGAPMIVHLELFYALTREPGFDERVPRRTMEGRFAMLSKNAALSWAAAVMDRGFASLHWEREQFPTVFHPKISVIHEGVDTVQVCPGPARFRFESKGLELTDRDPVVTYAARFLETMRGFETFLRAVPLILRAEPRAHVVIVGTDPPRDPYAELPAGRSPLGHLRAELGDELDPARVHFAGRLDSPDFLNLLRVSSVHVHLTMPFILSWSMFEAMACGAALVASNNSPVTEVVEDGKNGRLVDFFDPAGLAQAVTGLLADPTEARRLGAEARRTICERYDLETVCLPRQLALIEEVMEKGRS